MANELFFVKILADAMRHPEDVTGWRAALERIEQHCAAPRHRLAREQWRRFLETTLASAASGEAQAVAETAFRMVLLRTGREAPEVGFASASMGTQDPDREAFARGISLVQESMARASPVALQVHMDSELVASWALPWAGEATVSGLRPGMLAVSLDTGWQLWSGRLEAVDLLWHQAFPQTPLPVAAQSGPLPERASRRISLPVVMRSMVVFPGVESGSVRIVADPDLL